MRLSKLIIILSVLTILLTGCGTKKKAVSGSAVNEPTWHTCLIQGASATYINDDDRISASLTMQTVHDSMIVISVMPLLGMEMMRIEATPFEIIAIDKLHGRYASTTYAALNRKLTPAFNWDVLQQICTAELPTGPDKARLLYSFGDDTIELIINYTPRKLDVPVRVTNQRLTKYTEVDISKWL